MELKDYTSKAKPKAYAGDIPVFCAHDEIIEISKLKPNKNNPNTHPVNQIELLGRIIKATGWRQPITVSTLSGLVVKGHGRLQAAVMAGLTEAPVDYQNYSSEAEEYSDLVADNRLAEYSELDKRMLVDLFSDIDLEEIPIELTGYTGDEAEELKGLFEDQEIMEEVAEDTVPGVNIDEDPITKAGDIWVIGDHRLICGDSTNPETYEKLLGKERAQLIVTDPPYNVDYTGKTDKAFKIKNDKMNASMFRAFLTDAFTCMHDVSERGASAYIWYAEGNSTDFRTALDNAGFEYKQTLIWVKNNFVIGRAAYQWKHEPCIYATVEGQRYFIDDRTQSTVFEQEKLDINKLSKEELKQVLRNLLKSVDERESTVIYEIMPNKSNLHPTMKPIKLFTRHIINSSKVGWIVLDPFGGSGTTLICCDLTGRKARLIELDEYYCDVIVKRYVMTTGNKDIKLIRDGKEQPVDVYEKLLEVEGQED